MELIIKHIIYTLNGLEVAQCGFYGACKLLEFRVPPRQMQEQLAGTVCTQAACCAGSRPSTCWS